MSDRIVKSWAMALDKDYSFGFISLKLVTNTGAGFGILQDNNVLLAWIAVLAFILLAYFRKHFSLVAFIFISAGLIGNLVDRIFYGAVIDFISIGFWPVFNLADIYISLGVVLTLFDVLSEKSCDHRTDSAPRKSAYHVKSAKHRTKRASRHKY